jgi:plasmid stabilization system protein ParE
VGASERRDEGSDPESPRQPFRLCIEDEAEQDLVEAATYYETEQEGLAIRFHEAIWETLERILDNPHQYEAATRLLRRANVAKFPYSIY